MTNPFDTPQGRFNVLVNAEGQHSLWPATIDVPPGWTVAHTGEDRAACEAYVAAHWTDPRPAGLTAG
ncbi:MbtH family NRPS accessory protein [Streptomyces sp. HSW2009]|uniref:MbtH family protein n=1 Tax=Streptomyces sp. HSW2009 TaxID=3142890 RepID=UPI0032EF6438